MISKKKAIIGIAIAALTVGGVFIFGSNKTENNVSNAESAMVAYTLQPTNITETYSTTGTVVSTNGTDHYAAVSTTVEEVLVSEGEAVNEGDLLIKLDDDDILYNIKSAEYDLQMAKNSLSEIAIKGSTSYENAFNEASDDYTQAQSDYQSNTALYEAGAISRSELTASETALNNASNKYAEAQNNLDAYNASNEYELQQNKVEMLEIKLEGLYKDLENTEIRATADGTVTEVAVEVGDAVDKTSFLVQVNDLDSLEVDVAISEYDINKMAVGQTVWITTLSDKNVVYEGEVIEVGQIGDISGTEVTVPITIDVLSEGTDLRPNFSVTTEILIVEANGVLAVPFEALSKTPDGNYVVMKSDGEDLLPVMVETGATDELLVEIISDELSEGDVIKYSTNVTNISGTNDRATGMTPTGTGGGGGGKRN